MLYSTASILALTHNFSPVDSVGEGSYGRLGHAQSENERILKNIESLQGTYGLYFELVMYTIFPIPIISFGLVKNFLVYMYMCMYCIFI